MGSPEGTIEEMVTGKISIARNHVGRDGVMINAPANIGDEKSHYDNCIFGSITVNLGNPAVTSAGLNALPAKLISSAIRSTRQSTLTENPVQLYSSTGRKSGEAYAKICPELESNWISARMVRKCKHNTTQRETKKKATYEGNLLISTGYLVEFICPGKLCSHRFHIIKDAPFQFDMLYGVEFVGEN